MIMKRLLFLLFILPIALLGTSFSTDVSFDASKPEGFTTAPGRLRLPVYSVNILLPAGAEVESFMVEPGSPSALSQGYTDYNPAWYDGERIVRAEQHSADPALYTYLGLRKWGDLHYAAFSFVPAQPGSGLWYPGARISVEYSIKSRAQNRIPLTLKDTAFFANPARLNAWYETDANRNIPYLVVSTPELYAQLADWVSYRQSQGFSIYFFDIASILATSQGVNNADKLRNFLKDYYDTTQFMYLLLVGDHDVVPVAMLTPEPNGAETVPSDFFYSDLSSDFDTDNDGRWGEYYAVAGEQDWGVDYTPEVFVGRISTNNPAAVATIASRIVSFDSSTAPFKHKALLPAAFLNYNDEPEYGMPITDGAGFMELARQTVLRNYETTTLYEQIGVIPSYPSDYALDYAQLASLLSAQDYGIINWSAHGSATSSSRKVWIGDYDQDGIPGWGETEWMSMVNRTSFDNLNTAQGAVIFAASCYNGMIDNNTASLAEYALQKKGVAVFGATRTGWYKLGWQNPGWGGLSSYNYHLLENYAERQHSIGYAHSYANLLHTQYYLFGDPIDTGGIIWPELQNVYTYLLYGDPAVGHNTASSVSPLGEILVYDPDATDGNKVVNALRENANYNVVYTNRLIPDYDYLGSFEAIVCLLGYGTEASIPVSGTWEYNLLNDYLQSGGKMYLEGGINWDPQDSFLGKFGTHAPLDVVVNIEALSYADPSVNGTWAYSEPNFNTQALLTNIPTASVLFSTDNETSANTSIGILNVGTGYRTIASSFRLADVVDGDPLTSSDYKWLLRLIMHNLGLLNAFPVDSSDDVLPAARLKLDVWPNPMRGQATISIHGYEAKAPVELSIYNLKGQKVYSSMLGSGLSKDLLWNGCDQSGKACPNGIYFIKAASGQKGISRKLTLIR